MKFKHAPHVEPGPMSAPASPNHWASRLGGKLLTLEGIDGTGKTTQSRLLAQRLREAGLTVLETREPGGTPAGQTLRKVLLDPASGALAPQAELLLFLADRVQHLTERILPALAAGQVVVCDRFHDATLAYQAHGRGLDLAPLAPFMAQHIEPHLPFFTLWIDLPVEEALGRVSSRQPGPRETRLEDEGAAYMERVRKGYRALALAHPGRMVRIDGMGTPEQVAEDIWRRVQARCGE